MLTSPLTGDYRKKKPASVKAADVAVSMTPVGSAVEIAEELDKDDPSYGKVAIIAAGDALGAAIPAMGPVAKSLIKQSDKVVDLKDVPTVEAAGLTDEAIEKWRKENATSDKFRKSLKGRNEELQDLAAGVEEGRVFTSTYRERADELRPIRKVEEVPKPATFVEAVSALNAGKRKKPMIGLNASIPEGDIVTARLDIDAYTDYDVWVPTLTHPELKTVYKPSVILEDVSFIKPEGREPKKALSVAKGGAKAPFAVMTGKYVDATDDEAYRIAQEVFDNPEFTQVGYDPTRRGFFYDRETGEAIVEADTVVQVGHLVLARNAKKMDAEAFSFSEGGMALEDQMEMNFGREVPDNTIGIDPVSGNEIPLGSNAENVRDDIPANLSEGEIVIPADVVNFHGVKLFEDLRAEAKMGYAQMAADGRMGGQPMMEEEDMDIELTIEDLNVMDDEEPVEMAGGGMTAAQQAARSMSRAGIRNLSGAGSKSYKAAHNAAMKAQSVRDKNRKDRADRRRAAAAAAAASAAKAAPTNVASVNPNAGPTIAQQINFGGKGGFDFRDKRNPVQKLLGIGDSGPEAQVRKSAEAREQFRQTMDAARNRRLEKEAEEIDTGTAASGSTGSDPLITPAGANQSGGSMPNTFSVYDGTQGKSFMDVLTAPYYAVVGKDEEDMNEGGLVNPEPFYSQKGGFDLSHMEETGTYVQEYMNDEGHRIYVTFIDGVPQMEIPEGYYPVGPLTNLNTIINSSIPTMDGISPQPVQQSSSDRDKPETPAPTPVNYKELSIDELKAMIADQRTMGSKIFAGLSPLTKIIMWDQTRRTKGEIERRLEDPNTSEVDKMRLNNLLELMNREEPGLVKTLLDKATGKEFERIVSQIPKPVLPDVDYSDPTLAPDQGIAYTPDAQEESGTKIPNVEPEIPEPYQPEVPGQANLFSDATIEAAEKISKDAAEKSFSEPQPQSETGRMLQQQRDSASKRRKEARDRSRDIASVAKQTGSSIAQVGRDIAPSNERQNIDYGDPRRGMMNKGGIVKKKKSKKKKSK